MRGIDELYEIALRRKGGDEKIFGNLGNLLKSDCELLKVSDDRFLSEISRRVFQSAFSWKVIDSKWAGFEEVFFGFDVDRLNCISPEDYDKIMGDNRIVRNLRKVNSVIFNAEFFVRIREEFGSFGEFLVSWPKNDQLGLYYYLHKNGDRFGVTTTCYFLRSVGWDSYLLSRDVVKVLLREGVVNSKKSDYSPSSKKDLQLIQDAFNVWKSQSGGKFGYAEISKILVCTFDSEFRELIE